MTMFLAGGFIPFPYATGPADGWPALLLPLALALVVTIALVYAARPAAREKFEEPVQPLELRKAA